MKICLANLKTYLVVDALLLLCMLLRVWLQLRFWPRCLLYCFRVNMRSRLMRERWFRLLLYILCNGYAVEALGITFCSIYFLKDSFFPVKAHTYILIRFKLEHKEFTSIIYAASILVVISIGTWMLLFMMFESLKEHNPIDYVWLRLALWIPCYGAADETLGITFMSIYFTKNINFFEKNGHIIESNNLAGVILIVVLVVEWTFITTTVVKDFFKGDGASA